MNEKRRREIATLDCVWRSAHNGENNNVAFKQSGIDVLSFVSGLFVCLLLLLFLLLRFEWIAFCERVVCGGEVE